MTLEKEENTVEQLYEPSVTNSKEEDLSSLLSTGEVIQQSRQKPTKNLPSRPNDKVPIPKVSPQTTIVQRITGVLWIVLFTAGFSLLLKKNISVRYIVYFYLFETHNTR